MQNPLPPLQTKRRALHLSPARTSGPPHRSVLQNTEEGREFLFDILTTQLEADLETGYNDLSSSPAINLANGQVMDRNELYRNQICVDAEQIFDDSDRYFGFRIGYQCVFPQIYFTFFK